MNKTLRISFSLNNTYKVNGILYSLKQLPILKNILPQNLYGVKGLKLLANVLWAFWEIISAFLGKFIYFIIMLWGAGALLGEQQDSRAYLNILLFLSVIGALINTYIFNPTQARYYAIILMRMDAREYTLVNYAYAMLRTIIGFMPFSILFGLHSGVPLWICLLIPFSIAGLKIMVVALSLWDYERNGRTYNENKLGGYIWLCAGLLLCCAYVLPAIGLALPEPVSSGLLLICIPLGGLGIKKILSFKYYREVNQQQLFRLFSQMDTTAAQEAKAQSKKAISAGADIVSHRRGFEYLNELFIKRHRKILWSSVKKIMAVCLFLIAGVLLLFYFAPQIKPGVNEILGNSLPYFVFIMYAINRGTGFTQALFMNCDSSLLTYSFFKRPDMVLKLFKIRLREIIKINLAPALIIGAGLDLILFASGGSGVIDYFVMFISIICMSVFFSVHYLTLYYLLQPYNAGTEIKSVTYKLMMSATYLICFFLMQLKIPALIFGGACIVFCVLYVILACALLYKLAPRTFKLRM